MADYTAKIKSENIVGLLKVLVDFAVEQNMQVYIFDLLIKIVFIRFKYKLKIHF